MATGFWARVRRYYLAGLLVLAPTALTLWVAWKFFTFFDGILGGELRARGISVFGLGFVLLNLLVLLLGALAANFLGKRLFHFWDRAMHRVPLINKVYSTLRQIAEIFLGSGEDAAFRRVALVEYGSPGTHMVGFVTSTAPSEAGDKLGAKVCLETCWLRWRSRPMGRWSEWKLIVPPVHACWMLRWSGSSCSPRRSSHFPPTSGARRISFTSPATGHSRAAIFCCNKVSDWTGETSGAGATPMRVPRELA